MENSKSVCFSSNNSYLIASLVLSTPQLNYFEANC
jgi:hypothetical protein